MTIQNTLILDVLTWDLVIDLSGNIAVAEAPYSFAQDAASAIKTFAGEVWWDTTIGVPYWMQILGQAPPLALVKAQLNKAALSVPGVVKSQTFISGVNSRLLIGQVQIMDENNEVIGAAGF